MDPKRYIYIGCVHANSSKKLHNLDKKEKHVCQTMILQVHTYVEERISTLLIFTSKQQRKTTTSQNK